MLRQITFQQVALNFQTTVDEVKDQHNPLIVTHDGKPIVVMMSVDDYQHWFAERDQTFKYFGQFCRLVT